MLAQKKISQKQLVIYLSLIAAIIIVIVLVIFRGSIFGGGAPGAGQAEEDELSAAGINTIIKTRFDITKLKIFDVGIFSDARLRNLFEPSVEQRARPSIGTKNPFAPRPQAVPGEKTKP